jgi:hypothetical protein
MSGSLPGVAARNPVHERMTAKSSSPGMYSWARRSMRASIG